MLPCLGWHNCCCTLTLGIGGLAGENAGSLAIGSLRGLGTSNQGSGTSQQTQGGTAVHLQYQTLLHWLITCWEPQTLRSNGLWGL